MSRRGNRNESVEEMGAAKTQGQRSPTVAP